MIEVLTTATSPSCRPPASRCLGLASMGIAFGQCHQRAPSQQLDTIAEACTWIIIGILAIFLVEFVLQLLLFGPRWLLHWGHAIDVVVVSVSFVLELVLKSTGAEELVGLLVFVRLWRLARVVYTSRQLGEMEHGRDVEHLLQHIEKLQQELRASQGEAAQLRRRLEGVTDTGGMQR